MATLPIVTLRVQWTRLSRRRARWRAIIPVHTLAEDMNYVKGAHTLQFGMVARLNQNERIDYQNSFSGATANASWLVSSGAGLNAPWPDMARSQYTYFRYAMTDVMGLVTQGNAQYNYKVDGSVIPQGAPVLRNFKNNEFELYMQDTWKASRALTVTYGLRWVADAPGVRGQWPAGFAEHPAGRLVRHARRSGRAGQVADGSRTDLLHPEETRGGRDLYPFHKKDFSPRISMAYSPQWSDGWLAKLTGGPGKTSIRAGWEHVLRPVRFRADAFLQRDGAGPLHRAVEPGGDDDHPDGARLYWHQRDSGGHSAYGSGGQVPGRAAGHLPDHQRSGRQAESALQHERESELRPRVFQRLVHAGLVRGPLFAALAGPPGTSPCRPT